MIKGCSRRMIVLKDTGSDFFDEAYFVLKSGKQMCSISGEKDFVAEARRIISNSGSCELPSTKKAVKGKKTAFVGGFLVGAVLSFIVYLSPAF